MEKIKEIVDSSRIASPIISVVITAFKRRSFLLDAIESTVNQTIESDKFEVLVIKDFTDVRIDNRIMELGYRSFLYGGRVGEQLAIGIQNAIGKIISFLQDDDLFEPNKLQEIYNVFKRNEHLIYFKNNYSVINSDGYFGTNFSHSKTNSDFLITESIKRENYAITLMLKEKYDFNLSCMSIKKEVVLYFLNSLKMILTADDSFMFFISLMANGDLQYSKCKLNRYRVHDNGSTVRTGSIETMQRKNTLEFFNQIKTFEILQSISNNLNIYEALFEGIIIRKASIRIVQYDQLGQKISIKEILKLLTNHRTITNVFFAKLIFANILITISESFGRKIYYWYTKTIYNDTILKRKGLEK